jgi:hypothetical protein
MATFKRARRLDIERSVQVIEALGGTLKLSKEFGIRHPSVSNWKKYGIPESRLQFIQSKYKRIPAVKETLDFHPWKDR